MSVRSPLLPVLLGATLLWAAPSSADDLPLDAAAQRIFALQVALDRAGFSPGEIDARPGRNTNAALRAYQEAQGLPVTTASALDERTIASLGDIFTNPTASYAISAEDVAGPFVDRIPPDMMEKAQLSSLGFTSIHERLGERFHVSPALLKRLNPDATFERGEVIVVPNVGAAVDSPRHAAPASGALTIKVSESRKTLQVVDDAGEVVFHAPVTTGSDRDPLPIGTWKVNGVARNPTYHYNPELFWDSEPSHAKAKVAPGPNNPVGVVWIDLSKEHYGIHGTPEPSRIGHTASHGCIRLTNWDASRVAALVSPGTTVVLER